MATGTYSIKELLNITQPVMEFGEEVAYASIRDELIAHNARYNDMVSATATVTTERWLPYGTGSDGVMDEVDEFGDVRTQVERVEVEKIGLPLRKFAYAKGYTRDFLRRATVQQVAQRVVDAQKADVKALYLAIRRALFVPTNYTWRDIFVDRLPIDVKRLVNADSMAIPSFEGTTFDAATHTHYLGSATWTEAAIDALINTVREHGHTGQVRIRIAPTNVSSISALSKFDAAPKELIVYGVAADRPLVPDQGNRPDNNRIVGVWDGQYYVETKPWMPANYAFVNDVAGPAPLALRQPDIAGLAGLQLAAQHDDYPLRADTWERYFGFGISQRTNGAVGYMANATYAAPTLT